MVDVQQSAAAKRAQKIIILSLVLDLFAFACPLPLFPRIVDSFVEREAFARNATLLSRTLAGLRGFRSTLINLSPSKTVISAFDEGIARKHDVVLLGGMLGSAFSLCQFLTSPFIGRMADKHGRRPVLLVSMIGNILSGLLWVVSSSFSVYVASRLVGGLSECNVQMALASLADITPPDKRSRSMALVGLAFSIAFVFGPVTGAYFAAKRIPSLPYLPADKLNVYAVPAALTVGLLVLETVLLSIYLPETKGLVPDTTSKDAKPSTVDQRKKLRQLERLHFFFLFIFSGMEFSLTFLTFDLLGYSNRENGRLLGTIGLLAAFLQGGVVRRARMPPQRLVLTGLYSCCAALALLAYLPATRSTPQLYAAAACLATTSATVVTSLTALASIQAGEAEQATALGRFRSRGQLGRALGPIAAVSLYWVAGPMVCYAAGAILMAALVTTSRRGALQIVKGGTGGGRVKAGKQH